MSVDDSGDDEKGGRGLGGVQTAALTVTDQFVSLLYVSEGC